MPEITQRRSLAFDSLDDVVKEIDRLASSSYQTIGKWNLSQVANHLADWMSYPVDGFPKPPMVIGWMLALMRITIGRKKLNEFLRTRSMPTGKPTMPQTVHDSQQDVGQAVTRLKSAIEKFRAHKGEYHPSPLFGALTRDEATQLQLVHCAHHLGFLIPA